MKPRHLIIGIMAGLLGVSALMLASYWLVGRLFPTQTIGPAQSPPPAMEAEQPLPPSALTAEVSPFQPSSELRPGESGLESSQYERP